MHVMGEKKVITSEVMS